MKRKKAASAAKKSRRKYRKLEEDEEQGVPDQELDEHGTQQDRSPTADSQEVAVDQRGKNPPVDKADHDIGSGEETEHIPLRRSNDASKS